MNSPVSNYGRNYNNLTLKLKKLDQHIDLYQQGYNNWKYFQDHIFITGDETQITNCGNVFFKPKYSENFVLGRKEFFPLGWTLTFVSENILKCLLVNVWNTDKECTFKHRKSPSHYNSDDWLTKEGFKTYNEVLFDVI